MPYIGNNHIAGDHTNNFKVLDDISSFTATFDGSATSVVDTTNNTIRVVEHRFIQGQRVTYTNGGGGNIGGLATGTAYFIIFDSASTVKLATSASNAASSTAINLSAVGTGSSHTLNAAFDGVNTKFKLTHGSGTGARLNNATQINVAINNVVQRPNLDPNNFTDGFALEDNHKIVFQTAPTSEDIFWGSIIANTLSTFDISDHKIDTFTGDGSTTEFTLSHTPANNESLMVTINGVLQHPSNASTARAYTLIASIIQFTAAPGVGDEIQVRHIGFAGATTSDVSGFYGRTGNVVLTSNDHITTGNINAGIVTATSFDGTFSSNVGGSNANFTGIVTAGVFKGGDFDGRNLNISGIATFAGDVSIGGTLTYEDVTNIDAVGIVTAREGIFLPDNKHISLGTGNDMRIYSAAAGLNNSFIKKTGTGPLNFDFQGDFLIRNTAGSMRAKFAGPLGAIELYHSSQKKLETTAKGVLVGTGVTIETNGQATFSGITTSRIFDVGYSNSAISHGYFQAGRIKIFDNGSHCHFRFGDHPSYSPHQMYSSSVVNRTNSYYMQNTGATRYAIGWVHGSNHASGQGSVNLYYSGGYAPDYGVKLSTHSGGVLVSGVTTTRDLAVTGVSTFTGNIDANGDLDVDGHTNLDNVSIAGFTTITSSSNEELFRIQTSFGNGGGAQGKAYMGFDHFSVSQKPAILIGSEEDGVASHKGNFVVKLKDASATDDDPVQRFKIDSSGRVMIGRASPYASNDADNLIVGDEAVNEHQGITILSHSSKYGGIYFGDGAGSNPTERGKIIYDHPNDQLRIGTAGSAATQFYINSAGEVGISVSPASGHLLHIKNAGNAESKVKIESESGYDARLILDTSNGGGAGAHIDFQIDGTAKGGIQYVTNGSASDQHDIIFRNTNYTERLRIKDNGIVCLDDAAGAIVIGDNSINANYSSAKLYIRSGTHTQTSATTDMIQLSLYDRNSQRNGTEGTGSWKSKIQFLAAQINGGAREGAFIQQDIKYNNFSGGSTKMRADLVFATRGDAQSSSSDGAVEQLRITHNGHVLINGSTFYGTGNNSLQVHDSTLVLSKVGTGTRNWRFINNNLVSGNLGLQVSDADNGSTTYVDRIEIDKDGKVCIGNPATDPIANLEVHAANPILYVRDSAGTSVDNDAKIGFGNASHYPVAYLSHEWDGTNGIMTVHTRRSGNEYLALKIDADQKIRTRGATNIGHSGMVYIQGYSDPVADETHSNLTVRGEGGNGFACGTYEATANYASWIQAGYVPNFTPPGTSSIYPLVLQPNGAPVCIGNKNDASTTDAGLLRVQTVTGSTYTYQKWPLSIEHFNSSDVREQKFTFINEHSQGTQAKANSIFRQHAVPYQTDTTYQTFTDRIVYSHRPLYNQYSWYKFNVQAASSGRGGSARIAVTWSSRHAGPGGYGEYSIAWTDNHSTTRADVFCRKKHFLNSGGASHGPYNWSSSPDVVVYESTGGGSNAGFYLRVQGHVNANGGTYEGGILHHFDIVHNDNNTGANNTFFEFVSNSTPSEAGSALSFN